MDNTSKGLTSLEFMTVEEREDHIILLDFFLNIKYNLLLSKVFYQWIYYV